MAVLKHAGATYAFCCVGCRTVFAEQLRAARPLVHDLETFQRMRMENYFMDVPVFDAFDAIASIPHTSCTEREP
jgi:hypothetical protein